MHFKLTSCNILDMQNISWVRVPQQEREVKKDWDEERAIGYGR